MEDNGAFQAVGEWMEALPNIVPPKVDADGNHNPIKEDTTMDAKWQKRHDEAKAGKVGEGYRLVGDNEVVKKTDEVLNQRDGGHEHVREPGAIWGLDHSYGGEIAGTCKGYVTDEPRVFRRKVKVSMKKGVMR